MCLWRCASDGLEESKGRSKGSEHNQHNTSSTSRTVRCANICDSLFTTLVLQYFSFSITCRSLVLVKHGEHMLQYNHNPKFLISLSAVLYNSIDIKSVIHQFTNPSLHISGAAKKRKFWKEHFFILLTENPKNFSNPYPVMFVCSTKIYRTMLFLAGTPPKQIIGKWWVLLSFRIVFKDSLFASIVTVNQFFTSLCGKSGAKFSFECIIYFLQVNFHWFWTTSSSFELSKERLSRSHPNLTEPFCPTQICNWTIFLSYTFIS